MNIKQALKKIKRRLVNSSVASFFWYVVRGWKYSIPMLFYGMKAIDPNRVVFISFSSGRYADNPRAIAEKLHELYPEHEIWWGINKYESESSFPDFVNVIRNDGQKWLKLLATSGVWISNWLLPQGYLKRKGQLYIQTWHGDRGFKKVMFDAEQDNVEYRRRHKFRRIIETKICDLGISGSEYGTMQFRSAMRYKGKMLEKGTPRDDCLINLTEEKAIAIKEKLQIDPAAKVFMFAPTFRAETKGKQKVNDQLDLVEVLDELEKKTNGKWICIVRAHAGFNFSERFTDGRITDYTLYPDMADLLCITDLLLTDYSSTPGDFALTGKASILFQDDLEEYVSNDRTLYFDMAKSPLWWRTRKRN